MDEAWERAVEAALGGQEESSSPSLPAAAPRSLTLDGAVKCLQGRLPPPAILERYQTLEHLSIANVGASSLEKFARLRNLRRLILSDNRIAGGLEYLVEAGLDALLDLDLSNNRIQYLEDLAPLARLRLLSLDLYEFPVTRVTDYRQRVFAMIGTLKYLDKSDADENERPESDYEEDDEEEGDEDEEEDSGNGQIDGVVNGNGWGVGAVLDVDDDEETDADEEGDEVGGRPPASGQGPHSSNGFHFPLAPVEVASEDEENEDDDLGEEIDEEEDVEEQDVADSEDGGEDDDGEEVDGEEEEDVEDDEDVEPCNTGRMTSTEGEIDGHEQGEGDDEEDDNGEIGEEDELRVGEDRESQEVDGKDEGEGAEYLMQSIAQPVDDAGECDIDVHNEEDEVDDDGDPRSNEQPTSFAQLNKRKRDESEDLDDDGRKDSKKTPNHH